VLHEEARKKEMEQIGAEQKSTLYKYYTIEFLEQMGEKIGDHVNGG